MRASSERGASPSRQQHAEVTHSRLRVSFSSPSAVRAANPRAQPRDDPLSHQLTVRVSNASVERCARSPHRGAVRLSFSSDLLPVSTRVTIDRERTTVGDALHEVLRGTNLERLLSDPGIS
jgi:hypothetical protein